LEEREKKKTKEKKKQTNVVGFVFVSFVSMAKQLMVLRFKIRAFCF